GCSTRGGRPRGTPARRATGCYGSRTARREVSRRRRSRPGRMRSVGFIDVSGVGYTLPDGRSLFTDVSFRVGEGAKVALVGPNGAGKTTLLRMIAGDLPVPTGAIARTGGLGVMRQFIGSVGGERTSAEQAWSPAPRLVREAGDRRAPAEARLATGAEREQLAYAEALAGWGEAGGYDAEVLFDIVSVEVLGLSWERARTRQVR